MKRRRREREKMAQKQVLQKVRLPSIFSSALPESSLLLFFIYFFHSKCSKINGEMQALVTGEHQAMMKVKKKKRNTWQLAQEELFLLLDAPVFFNISRLSYSLISSKAHVVSHSFHTNINLTWNFVLLREKEQRRKR
jgi:hypothetical protein